jgi:putative transposase
MGTPEFTTYRRKLPHWQMTGAVYFVTWRFAKDQPALHPQERTLVMAAIRHFDALRYDLLAYVVMDDHVHVLVHPFGNHSLDEILHSWKSFTAKELRRLGQRATPVWQDEYFDRIVRDETDLIQKVEYILGNPLKRWHEIEEYPWMGLGSWSE